LVEAKLAACVNIIPNLESVYWWQGQIETCNLTRIFSFFIKTREMEKENI
jgi:uncharacterized protein involved in tolerance to divalent cations